MIIPVITPVRTGGSGGGCRAYESTGEMFTMLMFIITLSLIVISFGCMFFKLMREEDSVGGMVAVSSIVISLLLALWGLFFMCM